MFGTSGIRGTVGKDVTAELALSVGRAIGSTVDTRVVLGRDVRRSGSLLSDAISAGVRECGVNVIDIGVASTPTTARAVCWLEADLGITITASHNPPSDNGIKLWSDRGQAIGVGRQERLEQRIRRADYTLAPASDVGSIIKHNGATSRHVRSICEEVSVDNEPSVVVDVGNGTGGITSDVLEELGCSVLTINGQRDGEFPGRPSEPSAENLSTLREVVRRTGADLGVGHDGDADRMLAVDERGEFVPKDTLLALFAREAVSSGDAIAVPVDTSLAVDDTLEQIGGEVIHTKVGDGFVATEAAKPGVAFGGEPSGAWIWPELSLCPDGPLAAAKLVELLEVNGPLSKQVSAITCHPIRRTSIEVDDKFAVMNRLAEFLDGRYTAVNDLDGLRVDLDQGWFLIRASGTESLIRITAEARTDKAAGELFDEAKSHVYSTLERFD